MVNHSSNLTGNINDIKSIVKISREHNAIVIVDGSQTAGARKIDLKELDVHISQHMKNWMLQSML